MLKDCTPQDLGDWLINRSLIQELAKSSPVWLDIADVPKEFYAPLLSTNISILQDRLNVSHCRSLHLLVKRLFDRKARGARFVFLSPGHIANPEGDGRVAWVLKSIASLIYPCFGVTMVRCGCSFARLDSFNELFLSVFLLGGDPGNARTGTAPGDSGSGIRFCPILYFFTIKGEIVTTRSIPSGGQLVICIRNDRGSEAQREKWVARLPKIAGQLREGRGFLPVVAYQCDSDHEVA